MSFQHPSRLVRNGSSRRSGRCNGPTEQPTQLPGGAQISVSWPGRERPAVIVGPLGGSNGILLRAQDVEVKFILGAADSSRVQQGAHDAFVTGPQIYRPLGFDDDGVVGGTRDSRCCRRLLN